MAVEAIEQNIRSIQEIVDSYSELLVQVGKEKEVEEKRTYILKLVSNIKKLIKEEIFKIHKENGKA
ncbi:MAG TPA: hypothetical protein VJB94_01955 [Candidatus Nanoarchaeia archaeon]|nr:hypothetical protein [Candidatus Nanoarchaeia archaeon]